MKLLRKLDAIAATILLAGAAYTIVSGLRPTAREDQRMPTSTTAIGYGLLAAAGVYNAVRRWGPVSQRDRRIHQISQWYDQADGYYQRAQKYRQIAEKLAQRLYERRPTGK